MRAEGGVIVVVIGPQPAQGAPPVLEAGFTAREVAAVRRQVEEASRRCGLAPESVADWVTAVNELMTNAVKHGGGYGRLRLWHDGALVCEVRDSGRGFTVANYLGRSDRPTASAAGGMGLWIVQQMTDRVWIDSGPGGTVARVSVFT